MRARLRVMSPGSYVSLFNSPLFPQPIVPRALVPSFTNHRVIDNWKCPNGEWSTAYYTYMLLKPSHMVQPRVRTWNLTATWDQGFSVIAVQGLLIFHTHNYCRLAGIFYAYCTHCSHPKSSGRSRSLPFLDSGSRMLASDIKSLISHVQIQFESRRHSQRGRGKVCKH